ncbi:hypothetical protein G3N56_17645 [Desulfovibrio sulfodismutans]|uniref:Ricin-type beta-trefoil lectin domain protein n=1 Tax=Desulfolutivibrio sulfodismutans TaxID=63561 RepID=A0A7K3NR08_9BACT|nr:hypothetical protein [Desulfolutivibrio sulfodismutans]NDY58561.1 hypothetical protein [Desulfolutivibrio sulfodismutans]QLA13927.1 hypothetical protein GD606_17485 [Desulfolutivibrio sulfodismutans DSM 3696]
MRPARTSLLKLLMAFIAVAVMPALVQAQQCQSFTTNNDPQWGINPGQTFSYTQRVNVINNCADSAQVLLTTSDDPLSRALLAKSYTTSAGFPNKTFLASNTDANTFVLVANVVSGVPTAYTVASGATEQFCLPDAGAGSGSLKFVFGCTGFDTGNTGLPNNCLIGSDPGTNNNGMDTLFEYSPGCEYWGGARQSECTYNPSAPTQRLEGVDYFDTSAVTAYSIPMGVTIANWQSFNCSYSGRTLIADLASCPSEDTTTISTEYTSVCTPPSSNAFNLRLANQNSGWGSYSTACIAFDKWMALFGWQIGGGCNVALSTTPAGTASPTPNVADYYACSLLPFAGWDAYAQKCLTPGCGGPQCAVGPDGTEGVYATSKVAQGKGVPYMNYVKMLKATGNEVYTWMFDDGVGTLQCDTWGSTVTVTLCPGQAGQKPYDTANQKWSYNSTSNRCVVDSGGSYATQISCMAANGKYGCGTESVSKLDADNPGYIALAYLNYCKPLDPASVTPSQLAAGVSLAACQSSQCQQTGKLNAGDTPATGLLLLGQ